MGKLDDEIKARDEIQRKIIQNEASLKLKRSAIQRNSANSLLSLYEIIVRDMPDTEMLSLWLADIVGISLENFANNLAETDSNNAAFEFLSAVIIKIQSDKGVYFERYMEEVTAKKAP